MIPLRNLKRFLAKTCKQPLYAGKVLRKRLSAYGWYVFGKGKAVPPEAITLFLTRRCNLRCKMCGQWGEAGITRKQSQEALVEELNLAQFMKIVDSLSGFKPGITLFGGEPLLFPGCLELIKHIKQKGMHCLMITNGSLLEAAAKEIVDSGLDELNVSLDGDSSLHDEIRGMPGLFDRIISGLKQVQYFKEKNKWPLVNLQCTITKYNYEHLGQMTEVAKRIGADSLTFHNLIFLERSAIEKQRALDVLLGASSNDWEGFVAVPGIDADVLAKKKEEILKNKYDFAVDFYPNFTSAELADYYGNPCFSPPQQNSRCLSPWLVAYILPDGEVRPCLNFSFSFGNALEEPFLKIWNSPKARNFRNLLKKNKIFPACVRCTELYRY